MNASKILITGGAGYIGSHTVKLLGEKGYDPLIYDNLIKGHSKAVLYGYLFLGDLLDKETLNNVISSFKPDVVIHFAGLIEVAESVKEPVKYYENNVSGTINLLDAMQKNNIDKIIFSSSAAVYGMPDTFPITEEAPLNPINPYGRSKLIVEEILNEISSIKYISLRYFNAAGADPLGRIGENHNPETHLIPLILKTAKGKREYVRIFGTNYPTSDGTCIRDYIHVEDLAEAHFLSMNHLVSGGKSEIFNCGYGHGYSVREIVDVSKKITGIDFKVEETERRAGDPPLLVAGNNKIKKTFSWQPKYDDLEFIIKTAWEWEKKLD
jgi:UDP-glucose 4-epimerase